MEVRWKENLVHQLKVTQSAVFPACVVRTLCLQSAASFVQSWLLKRLEDKESEKTASWLRKCLAAVSQNRHICTSSMMKSAGLNPAMTCKQFSSQPLVPAKVLCLKTRLVKVGGCPQENPHLRTQIRGHLESSPNLNYHPPWMVMVQNKGLIRAY